VYEYDPGPDKWAKKKILPQRVHHQAQAVYNNKIYVLGGCKQGIFGTDAVTNVWEYDPATDNYRAMAPIPGPRCSAVAATVNNKIYLIGGIEPFENGKGSRISGRNQVFDPVANTWGRRRPQPDAHDAQSCICRCGEQQDLCHRRTSIGRDDSLQQQYRRR
jgi:N-acetylneuraminic acid mutarotase